MESLHIPLKINVVLQQNFNAGEWKELVLLAKDHPLDVRFIELMPTGYGKELSPISNSELLEKLTYTFGSLIPEERSHGNGPARYYHIEGFQGSIGFISAIHGKFCNQCNRIRLTATGELKPCLCYGDHISIKKAIRTGSPEDVRQLLTQAIYQKPAAHCFETISAVTETNEMSRIGG